MKDQVVLVDKDDNVIGLEDKVKAHKEPFPLHRAISVILFDPSGTKLLIQKRSEYKPTWPLFWSNTCCTHPKEKESILDCARRRLKEELGIDCGDLKEKFKFVYKVIYDEVYGEHELDHVLIGKYSGKIKPDSKEVADYKWINIEELIDDIRRNPNKYTPWFKMILRKINLIPKD